MNSMLFKGTLTQVLSELKDTSFVVPFSSPNFTFLEVKCLNLCGSLPSKAFI